MNRVASVLAAIILCVLASDAMPATTYDVIDLGTLPGGIWSGSYGINGSGQVVGRAGIPGPSEHGFLYSSGSMEDLGTLGGSYSYAMAVNDSGQVVGWSPPSGSYINHAFIYSNNSMEDLGPGQARGINAAGHVVGSGYGHAFVIIPENGIWYCDDNDDGVNDFLQDLGTLGGDYSTARDINDNGQIVGHADPTAGSYHAFLYSDGSMEDLGTLGGIWSDAYAINNNGQIVGGSVTTAGYSHAFFARMIQCMISARLAEHEVMLWILMTMDKS